MTLNLILFPSRGEEKLFNLDLCTSLFEGSLERLSFSLGYFLFQSCRSLVNEVLRLLEAETESFLDGLDDAELRLTGGSEDDVEFGLLCRGGCLSRSGCDCNGCSCRLDAIFILEDLSEFLNVFHSKVYQLFCECFDVCLNCLFLNC